MTIAPRYEPAITLKKPSLRFLALRTAENVWAWLGFSHMTNLTKLIGKIPPQKIFEIHIKYFEKTIDFDVT